jgi:DNA polymerase-3 subunit delta
VTPEQFLAHIQRQNPSPVNLFLGPEPYRREMCRRALVERALPPEERQDGFARHDLDEITLAAVLDDARSLSLFAPRRVLWVSNAEAVLPRGRTVSDDDPGGEGRKSGAAVLAGYLKDPTPGVTVVLDAARYEFEGEDKQKVERVRKFYSMIPAIVEFPRFQALEARQLARDLVRAAGLEIDREAMDLLVESLGNDALRISAEIEKLRLYSASGKTIGAEALAALVPDASASTIFGLVDSLGRRDRRKALELLHLLVRQGEYLPLALAFLATHFRMALVTKEAGLRGAQQIQDYFSRPGRAVWRGKAEQIQNTASLFSSRELGSVLKRIFDADHALRDARPDDRIVMENFVLGIRPARASK